MQYQKLGCNMSIKILFISILISVVTACGMVSDEKTNVSIKENLFNIIKTVCLSMIREVW